MTLCPSFITPVAWLFHRICFTVHGSVKSFQIVVVLPNKRLKNMYLQEYRRCELRKDRGLELCTGEHVLS